MPLNFPASPTINDTYAFGDKTWTWNGSAWLIQSYTLRANAAFDAANTAQVTAAAAFDKANQTAQLAFTTVTANGTSLVADANTDTLTITTAMANGIFVTGTAGTDTLDIGLLDSGVTAAAYGSTSAIPVITVDAKGRLTTVTTAAVDTTTASAAYAHANGAFTAANTAQTTATAAFTAANTKFASAGGTISGDVSVTGNLTIIGQTVYANTSTTLIADNIVTLNAAISQIAAPSVNAGVEVDRGSSANVALLWNETSDTWTFTNDGSTYFDIADAARVTSAFAHANGAFGVANSSTITAQAAFDAANTKFASTGGTISGEVTVTGNLLMSGTGYLNLPAGTTAQRPSVATTGMFRYNSTTAAFEGYTSAWGSVGGGANVINDTATTSALYPLFASATSGTPGSLYTSNAKLLYKPSTGELKVTTPVALNGLLVNANTVTANCTIETGYNAISVGPMTVSGNISVTVSSGQRWLVL